jgi:hypothetical protein
VSCCLYKYRLRSIVIITNTNRIYIFHTFALVFLLFSFFLQLDLLAAATTSKVVVVHASPPSRCRLAGGGETHRSPVVPLTAVSPDKAGQSGLPNWTIWFLQFWVGASGLCFFMWQHKVPSWAKYLANDCTPLTKVAQIKTVPASHKLSVNQDKSTYTCGEQEKLIELWNFSMCSTLQSWHVI